jgi:hypothetical protein
MVAWLITSHQMKYRSGEKFGPFEEVDVVAARNYRRSTGQIQETLRFLYAHLRYSTSETLKWAAGKMRPPEIRYTHQVEESIELPDGSVDSRTHWYLYDLRIGTGNHYLRARIVDDLQLYTLKDGSSVIQWRERKPAEKRHEWPLRDPEAALQTCRREPSHFLSTD